MFFLFSTLCAACSNLRFRGNVWAALSHRLESSRTNRPCLWAAAIWAAPVIPPDAHFGVSCFRLSLSVTGHQIYLFIEGEKMT